MIAYLILVHKNPKQFKQLFKAIYTPDNYYAIHVDKRSGVSLNSEIKDFLKVYPNTILLKSKNALWGGYSLVEAELRGIRALVKMGANWDFFINLSGQDFPLRSQAKILKFLADNPGKDFIKVADQRKMRPGTVSRFENFCLEFKNRIIRTSIKRRFLSGATPYIGNQWMILSRRFCEFLAKSREVGRFEKFYRRTFIADEGFFQTVIMNTSYQAQIVNDDLRAIDWVPQGKIKLRPRNYILKDAAELLASHNLFARKFDENVDQKILDALELSLAAV